MIVQKPWGFERDCLSNERFSLWRLTIKPGHETSLHYHANKDAFILVEDGVLEFEREGTKRCMFKGDFAIVTRGTPHRLGSKTGAAVIELEWPPSREDLVRLEDKYGRAGS